MGCVGCPSAQMETLEEAAAVHGLNLEALLKNLINKRGIVQPIINYFRRI